MKAPAAAILTAAEAVKWADALRETLRRTVFVALPDSPRQHAGAASQAQRRSRRASHVAVIDNWPHTTCLSGSPYWCAVVDAAKAGLCATIHTSTSRAASGSGQAQLHQCPIHCRLCAHDEEDRRSVWQVHHSCCLRFIQLESARLIPDSQCLRSVLSAGSAYPLRAVPWKR